MPQSLNSRKELFILPGILCIAFILRILLIGNQSLWIDEAVIYFQTDVDSVSQVYQNVMSQEGHIGPLYHILNFLFSRFLGFSERALRFPAALYGTAAVLFFYFIVRKMCNEKMARIAAILFALAPLEIWYSQEARMYSLWVMLQLLWFHRFLYFLEKPDWKNTGLLTLFSILNIWTFLNSLFLFFAAGVYLLINLKKEKKALLLYIGVIILAFLSYLPGFLTLLGHGSQEVVTKVGSKRGTSIFDFGYAFWAFNCGTTLGPSLVKIREMLSTLGKGAIPVLLKSYGGIMIPALLFYGALFVFSLIEVLRNWKKNLLFLIILIIPLVLIFFITVFSSLLPFNIRYILNLHPFYILLLVMGISRLPFGGNKAKTIGLLVMVFFSFLSLGNYYFNKEYAKIDFKSAITYLDENMQEGDGALILHEGGSLLLGYYDPSGKYLDNYIRYMDREMSASKEIINSARERFFYIKTSRVQMYDQISLKRIEDELDSRFPEKERIKGFVNISVYMYH